MIFYGEALLKLGILIIIAAICITVLFAIISILRYKGIKNRLAEEYGEKPDK